MPNNPVPGRFRALVAHTADAIWLLAATGRIVYANPASREVLGYAPEELTATDAFDYFLPTDREAARQRLWEPQAAAASFRMRRRDGKIIWVDATAANRLEDPEVVGVIVSLRDVTESRRAEQALRDSESRFRALIESSSGGFVLIDREGTVVYSGPPVLGYEKGSFVGRSILEVIHPDDLEQACNDLAAVASAAGKRLDDEFRARHADGSWRWLEVRMRNLLTNPAVNGIVVNYRDITARRAHEGELRRTRDQLKQILESIRESFVAVDREWRFTYVNGHVAKALGKPAEELIGKNLWDEFPGARDTELYPAYRRVMTERVPVQIELLYPPSGRWYDIHAYPTEEGMSVNALDISERKRAERRAATLHEVTRALVESSRLSEIAPRVLRAIRDGLGCSSATFWKLDDSGAMRAWRGKSGRTIVQGEGAAGLAWSTGRPSASDGGFAFPVKQDGETIGVMEFVCPEPPDQELLRQMDAIEEQIAQALSR
jgi:PAS domain S-box-containing protein